MKTFKEGDNTLVISRNNTEQRFGLNPRMVQIGDTITIKSTNTKNNSVRCMDNYRWDIFDLKHCNKEQRIQQLERELEELKSPRFNVGDWVVYNSYSLNDFIFRISKIDKKHYWNEFGLELDGTYLDGGGYCSMDTTDASLRKATPSEIESCLIKEANKRGYKEGVVIKSAMNQTKVEIGDLQYNFNRDGTGDDLSLGGCCIYRMGKWAEIIDQPTFFDWEVRHDDDTFRFYCKGHNTYAGVTYNKNILEQILYDLDRFNDDTTVKELKRELNKFVSNDLPF